MPSIHPLSTRCPDIEPTGSLAVTGGINFPLSPVRHPTQCTSISPGAAIRGASCCRTLLSVTLLPPWSHTR